MNLEERTGCSGRRPCLPHSVRSAKGGRQGRLPLPVIILAAVWVALARPLSFAAPLALHPENPHYFLFHGKPTLLITSGEHYGVLLNLDFDYAKYFDTLAADGLNLTRVFSGAYVEPPGAFNIANNTLAPERGRFVCPWARSDQSGYANGGNKFDLTRWDDAYFARLRDLVAHAAKRGIVIEMNLFCPMYKDAQWALSPMNAANNVNEVGDVAREAVYDLGKNGNLEPVQEALTRKIVAELAGAENVYFEICNEPYSRNTGVTMAWQERIADVIVDAEKSLAPDTRHLISLNIANKSKKVEQPHPAISIFNFHYASPPDAVTQNYGLNKVIGLNETGFKGTGDDHYRMEAWEFLLAGGGLYNHLDYSFVTGHEDGTFAYTATTPGGGNAGYRRQLKVLADFLRRFDFVRMRPARELVRDPLPKDARCQVLAEAGRQYAMYFKGASGFRFQIDLPAGRFRSEWVEVMNGHRLIYPSFVHGGGARTLMVPIGLNEVALRIRRLD